MNDPRYDIFLALGSPVAVAGAFTDAAGPGTGMTAAIFANPCALALRHAP